MKSNAGSHFAKWRQAIIGIAALCLIAGGPGDAPVARAASAATYPDRPIKVVVPFAAGARIDIAARLVGGQLSDVRERFALRGAEPLTPSPDPFTAEIREAVARWPAIVKAEGIRTE